MTEFLKPRIGAHQYKSPRQDGNQDFIIDEQLITEFADLEEHQFDNYNPAYKERIWGIFGEQDTLAHFEPLFLQYYSHSYHFPGGHTPTAEEVHQYYVPLIEKLIAPILCAADRKANKIKCYLIIFAFCRLSKSLQKSVHGVSFFFLFGGKDTNFYSILGFFQEKWPFSLTFSYKTTALSKICSIFVPKFRN